MSRWGASGMISQEGLLPLPLPHSQETVQVGQPKPGRGWLLSGCHLGFSPSSIYTACRSDSHSL